MHRRAARTLVAALTATLLVPATAGADHSVTTAPEGEDSELVVNASPLTTSCEARSGTATEGADFEGGTVVTPGGSGEIPVLEDDIYEGDETVVVECDDHDAFGIITDNDAPPALSIADVSVSEREGPAKVTISASRASGQGITIPLSTTNGSAGSADFTAPSSVTLPAGARSVDAEVPLTNDFEDEVDETFSLVLGAPSNNATVADGEGVVTIVNDDLRVVDLFEASTLEGDGGTSIARFGIRLNAPTFRTVTVGFATSDGTATAPSDYLSRLGSATFAPGQTAAFVEVQVVGDDAPEPGEVFTLTVTGIDNARLGDGVALGVIADDDDTGQSGSADVRPPQMTLRGPHAKGRSVTLRVACPGGERSCKGRVAFFTARDKRSPARSLRKERRIGRKAFSLSGGAAKTVSVPVPGSILAAARRARRLKVQAFVVTEDAAGNVDTRIVRATLRYGARRSR